MSAGWELPLAVSGGASAGLGVFLLARQLLPATPALGPALRRLHQPPSTMAAQRSTVLAGLATRIRVPAQALALLGRTPEQYTLSLLTSGLIGLALPALATLLISAMGAGIPLVIPIAAGPALAGVFVVIAHRDVLAKATRARREFTRAVCTYLDLVALQLAAAHGPVQALDRAAQTCHGWVFARIREALLRAQLQMRPPWVELRDLAEQIGVPELGDVGAIMHTSGTQGAQVGVSLRERADSLRDQIRTDALGRAEAVTAKLEIPAAALLLTLVLFVLYPLLTRV